MLQAKETTCAKAGNKASEIKFRMSGGVDSEDRGGDSKLQRTERLNLQTLNVPGRVSSTSRTRGPPKGFKLQSFGRISSWSNTIRMHTASLFSFFFFLFFFFLFVVNFVIHCIEKALGSHVFPHTASQFTGSSKVIHLLNPTNGSLGRYC